MTDPRTVITRRSLLAGGLALTLASSAHAATPVIRIGYQRYSTLVILKASGALEKALAGRANVVWSEFVAGPQLLQALVAGALDLGQTGDAPPVFASAASPDALVYVGHEPPAPLAEAILVPKDSSIRTLADLKGKRIALNRASNVHWFLLQVLHKAGLSFHDIKPAYLTPPSARSAFESGQIDAWAIWDPYLSSALSNSPRILTTAQDIVANREFFLARRGFAESQPDLLREALHQITQTDDWAQAHKPEVSRLLATQTGLPYDTVYSAIKTRDFSYAPMSAEIIQEQQQVADGFLKEGLLPSHVDIGSTVWK
ncbi:aliphatic sulfonate ABC transporter substrate-binding protein [Gluconobacter cerinus]|uniref:Putative aliphatic sulfonates-binding protein n=1 Tax=Gluconobacter cerinus TaxID=38307 RepID=A0AAV5NCW2_9PROT|nr:aliphatic sulfonate ABC transporter substrate-binding protein [Gluconobacter cerinus]GBQ97663.1 aliphatic sulphonate ABC transporter periplasmic protein [Gluconobacter cerinus NRIC 0229]GLQ61787.1 sulfonate ABC transporter substrate-binding protein [Gluconobacter cerinus]